MQIDWTKMLTVTIVTLGTIFLAYFGRIDSQAAVAILGAALGYVFGNSHGLMESRRIMAQQNAGQEAA